MIKIMYFWFIIGVLSGIGIGSYIGLSFHEQEVMPDPVCIQDTITHTIYSNSLTFMCDSPEGLIKCPESIAMK